ncbi:MAG: hypothetical protein OXQ32_07845 [bacterium]|nr:hypothetical protein [bacterium]
MRTKLPTAVSLVVLVVATWFEWYWVWGVLYLYWGVQSLGAGEAFLVQTVRRDGNPVLFWSVSAMWLILAVLVIVTDLFPGVDAWLGGTGG